MALAPAGACLPASQPVPRQLQWDAAARGPACHAHNSPLRPAPLPSLKPAAQPFRPQQEVEFEAGGKKARGAHTAARYLASLGGAAAQLLGDAPEQQAKVHGWVGGGGEAREVRGSALPRGAPRGWLCAQQHACRRRRRRAGLRRFQGGREAAAPWSPSPQRRPLLPLPPPPPPHRQIAEWLSFQHSALGPGGLLDASLAELNAALEARTYLAGGAQPSLADLVLYAAVAPAAAAFPVAQHGHFCNLLRW